MNTSLRDQLLKAQLISEKQAKDAERELERKQHGRAQLPKKQRTQPSPAEIAAREAQAAKAARDQEISRRAEEKAQRKALRAQIRQLVDQHQLPPATGDDRYNFVDGGAIRRITVDATLRARLQSGDIAIVRCDKRYSLVPADAAAKIRERDATAVINLDAKPPETPVEPGYEQFAVPDDLMW